VRRPRGLSLVLLTRGMVAHERAWHNSMNSRAAHGRRVEKARKSMGTLVGLVRPCHRRSALSFATIEVIAESEESVASSNS